MRAVTALLLVSVHAALAAQATASFEVVSVKPGSEASPFRSMRLQNNRWTAARVTVREVIKEAYKSEGLDMPDRVVGGPGWLDEDQFDIVATSASTPTKAQLEAMLRAMLVERFHLATHLEKKTMAAFELTLTRRDGRLGPGLQRTTTDCEPRCGVSFMYGETILMKSDGVDMTRFGFMLSTVVHQPVIDHTGLKGQFTVRMDFAPGTDFVAPPPSDAPSLFTAVEEQLGLKLKSVKAPLDVLVVDRADRPTLN